MKRFVATLVVALATTFAFAQGPISTFYGLNDHLVGEVVPCNSTELTLEMTEGYPYSVCGWIGDQYTNVNKRWTNEYLGERGWYVTPWELQFAQNGVELWMAGIANGRYSGAITLITSTNTDGTAFIAVAEPDN